jgi:hypothetical protein
MSRFEELAKAAAGRVQSILHTVADFRSMPQILPRDAAALSPIGRRANQLRRAY